MTVAFCVKFCERDGGLEGVLDLASVPWASLGFQEGFVVLFRVSLDCFAIHFDTPPVLNQAFQVHFPDLDGRVLIELGIVKFHVDAGLEGFVEIPHFVGGEKEDSGVVFEHA